MTCRIGSSVIVCGPPRGIYRRRILPCPICERRHRFIERHDGVWYGSTYYGSCGDSWQDGELGYRPFRRGWRKEAQAEFRAMWEHSLTRNTYDAVWKAESRLYGPEVKTLQQQRKADRRYRIALELARRERTAA